MKPAPIGTIIFKSLGILFVEGTSVITLAMVALLFPLLTYWIFLQSNIPTIFTSAVLALSLSYLHLALAYLAGEVFHKRAVQFMDIMIAPFKKTLSLIIFAPFILLVLNGFSLYILPGFVLYLLLSAFYAAAGTTDLGPGAAIRNGMAFLKKRFGRCLGSWCVTLLLQAVTITTLAMLFYTFYLLNVYAPNIFEATSGQFVDFKALKAMPAPSVVLQAAVVLGLTFSSFAYPIIITLLYKYHENEN